MPAPMYYTADMVRALPDDGMRYETSFPAVMARRTERELAMARTNSSGRRAASIGARVSVAPAR